MAHLAYRNSRSKSCSPRTRTILCSMAPWMRSSKLTRWKPILAKMYGFTSVSAAPTCPPASMLLAKYSKVYEHGTLSSPPVADVQTILVPPGGATIVEFKVDYPGRYMLVDHALSRMEKGLTGY